MFDYLGWTSRARQFVENMKQLHGRIKVEVDVAPPLSRRELDELVKQLPMGLPSVLSEFLCVGSSNCSCHYWWEPSRETDKNALRGIFPSEEFIYGGASLCDANQLAWLQGIRLDWAESFDGNDEDSIQNKQLWTNCTPFAFIKNGDLLAVDATVRNNDPPVVYLAHDDQSSVIAPSFTDFLSEWEKISYIGPEIWLLSEWISRDGYVDCRNPKTPALKKLLTST